MDTRVRAPKDKIEDPPRIIGFDASGVVASVGPVITLFEPGDEVYYAGDLLESRSHDEQRSEP